MRHARTMNDAVNEAEPRRLSPWREKLWRVIFLADTPSAKGFDIALLVCIALSVAVVILDSVNSLHDRYGQWLFALEIFFTAIFTVEYVLRLVCARRPHRYALSFFGIIDLLAILPTYFLFFGVQYLAAVRVLRLLRIFRILKLGHYLSQARVITTALHASRHKIAVFLYAVVMITIVFGAVMYVVEQGNDDFDSIPKSMWWAVVTLSTVGYGDVVPESPLGKLIAGIIIIMGYGIIALPTGIVTVEMARAAEGEPRECDSCARVIRDRSAVHCKFCGERLQARD